MVLTLHTSGQDEPQWVPREADQADEDRHGGEEARDRVGGTGARGLDRVHLRSARAKAVRGERA